MSPLEFPTEKECRWLVDQGVDPDALIQPGPIRAASVTFFRDAFDFDADGQRALLFLEERDAIAWQPTRGLLRPWRGVAFALNEEAIFNPGTYFAGGALRVHATPLEWLQAGREGIVIVQHRYDYAMLRHAPRLSFQTEGHARAVQARMQPPKVQNKFLVEQTAEGIAA